MRARISVITAMLLLAASSAAQAHPDPGEDPWHETWHDVGTAFGPFTNPLGVETGVCWNTDSSFLASRSLEEVNGHRVALAIDPERDCHGDTYGDDAGVQVIAYWSSLYLPGDHDGKAAKVDIKANGISRDITLAEPDDVRLSPVTDSYATVISLAGEDPASMAPREDGSYLVRGWIMDYTGPAGDTNGIADGRIMDLLPHVGRGAELRIWDERALRFGADPLDAPCGEHEGLLVVCGAIDDEQFPLILGHIGVDVALPEDRLRQFHGRPVAISLSLDFSDETHGLFGSADLAAMGLTYEPGFGLYNVAKSATALTPLGSAFDLAITPVMILPSSIGVRACGESDGDAGYHGRGDDAAVEEYVWVEARGPVIHIETLDGEPTLQGIGIVVDDMQDGRRDGGGYAHAGLYFADEEVHGAGTDSLGDTGTDWGPPRRCPGP